MYIEIECFFSVYNNLSFNTPNAVHVHKNLSKFTMTYKMYFHAPKCTFNPDPIWDQKWSTV